MSADHWNSGVRTFGYAGEDEEEWTSHARPEPAAVGASARQFAHEEELARQREVEEVEERERERERELQERVAFNIEQDRLSRLIASGQTRHVNLDPRL